MSVVIRLENLSKRYRLGDINRRMLYEDMQRFWAKLWRKEDPLALLDGTSQKGADTPKEIWALKDVNLEIRDGDVVGIIGRNGSGKSTLLKILSKITAPTQGRALIKGRVASLLEVGTGFHAEMTGRENVYMNGSVLGMSREEIDSKFDEIVDFAGVEKFIDTPVKRYSSGMMVRLAFAVAAHIDPEIMIIDEVLAVGDSAFQQKCLNRMNQVAREGRTILFVSHQAAAVENLCTRGVVLENGVVKFDGTQSQAISHYIGSFSQPTGCLRDRTDRKGNGQIRIVALELRDEGGQVITTARAGHEVEVWLHFENNRPDLQWPNLLVSVNVKTQMDVPVFMQANWLTNQSFGSTLPERGTFVCRLARLPLPPGAYRLAFWVVSAPKGGVYLDAMETACSFHVEGGDFFGSGQLPDSHYGVALAEGHWRLEEDSSVAPSREMEVMPRL